MNRHRIISLPDANLRKPSAAVTDLPAAKKLAEQMIKATLDWEDNREHEFGVALAAIQINRPLSIIVVRHYLEDKGSRGFDVFINPRITRTEGEPASELEGCLSVKDTYGKVARYPKVKIKAQDLSGKVISRVAKGFMARVFQHEIDHINGITFVDRCGPHGEFVTLLPDGSMEKLTVAQRAAFLKRVGCRPPKDEPQYAAP